MPALLFKLVISKAFNIVSWEYVLELLKHRGFSHKWRDWLSLLFKSAHSLALLNGVPGERVNHTRGLHQGIPLLDSVHTFVIEDRHNLTRTMCVVKSYWWMRVVKSCWCNVCVHV
jgi:hypothetical protein